MNNYEYILAGAPDFQVDTRSGFSPDAAIDEIVSLLSDSDRETADLLLKGFIPDCLTEDFYREAAGSRSRFIREYFDFDRQVRNVRAEFINKAFDRDPGAGRILPDDDFDRKAEVNEILSGKDILKKEREIDALMWEKAESISQFSIFDLDSVLSLVTRLKIVARWMNLDAESGHAMLQKLVTQLRQNSNKEQ